MNRKEIPIIRLQAWDTAFFQFKTGYVQIPPQQAVASDLILRLEENAAAHNYRLLYIWLAEGERIAPAVLESLSDRLIHADEKINYVKTLWPGVALSVVESDCSYPIKSYAPLTPSAELYELAFESGHYSRFKQDRRFPSGIFENLYRCWIERSVNREIAEDVLVFEEKGRVEGMLTYQITPQSGRIGLIAVSPEVRHKGVASLLMREFETRMKQKGIQTVEVATQGKNFPACRFYEKQGFHVHTSINIYHLWL